MNRALAAALLLIAAQPAFAAAFTRAGWYRLEVLPSLAIDSQRFASEQICTQSIAKDEDRVVRCVHLAKKGDEIDRAIDIFGATLKENPRDAARFTASTTSGCAWPSTIGPHEQTRSR